MAKYAFSTTPHSGRQLVGDTETTGLSTKYGDRIVEVALTELVDGKPTGRTFHRYINPECSVPPEAISVHGLTDAFLANKPVFADIAQDLYDFIEDPSVPIWFHNAPFDKKFMNYELDQVGMPELANVQCSLKLARAVLGRGSRTLAILADMAGVTFGGRGAHSALADTEVLGKVLCGFLWPKEIELALNPNAAQAALSPSAKKKDTKKAPAQNATPIRLPEGLTPLTAEQDERICRYDEHEIDHLVTARGKRWTREEEQGLIDRFLDEKKGIIDLVEIHGRTPAALMLKLEGLGVVAEGHPYTRINR